MQVFKILRGCALAYVLCVVITMIASGIAFNRDLGDLPDVLMIAAVLTGSIALVTFGTWVGLASSKVVVKAWQAIGGLALSLLGFFLIGAAASGDLGDAGVMIAIVLAAGLILGAAIWIGAFGFVRAKQMTFEKPEV